MGGFKMRFKTLYLENFRNFKEETIDFNEYMDEIAAPNGWGKTTIADAIMWILTGKLVFWFIGPDVTKTAS